MSQRHGEFDDGEYGSQVCNVCGGSDFRIVAGFLACTICGTQSQDFQQSQSEFNEFVQLRKVRKVQKKRQPPVLETFAEHDSNRTAAAAAAAAPTLDTGNGAITHLRKFQDLLQRQVKALCAFFQCHRSFEGVVKKIWFRMLNLDEDMLRLNEINLKVEDSGGNEAYEKNTSRTIVENLPLERTLAILMLAILVLREPVMPVDLARAILLAKVPLFEVPDRVGDTLIIMKSLLADSATLSRSLLLPAPKINVGGLTLRFLHELKLPLDISLHVHRLNSLLPESADEYLSISEESVGQKRRGGLNYSPYPYVLGLLLVTLKLLYGLDGSPAKREMPVKSWVSWAKHLVLGLNLGWWGTKSNSVPNRELREYFDFMREHFIPLEGGDISDSMRSTYKQLNDIIRQQEQAAGFSAPDDKKQGFEDDDNREKARHAGKQKKTAGSYVMYHEDCSAFHIDYQAVLLAMSSVFWIKPHFIHHAAIKYEQLMVLKEEEEGG